MEKCRLVSILGTPLKNFGDGSYCAYARTRVKDLVPRCSDNGWRGRCWDWFPKRKTG